jgi:sirohydrochlorin ferrochelatase
MAVVRARARRAGLEGLQVRAAYLGHALPSVADVLGALSEEALSEETPSEEARSESAIAPITDALGPGPSRRRGHPPFNGRRTVVVLPLLLTPAYHSDTDLPAVLHEAAGRLPRLRISYGDPLGPHPLLLRALGRRLAEAGMPEPAPDTAVVLASAGSSRPTANAAVASAAAALQSARGWRAVVPAFASAASPKPDQAVAGLLRAGAARVVVASYLLAPGHFADQVRASSLAAGAAAVSSPLGAAPEMADLILKRYAQAAPLPRAATIPRAATF